MPSSALLERERGGGGPAAFSSSVVETPAQTELELADPRCELCWYCGTPLPLGWSRFEHCDPRPPQLGWWLSERLALQEGAPDC